MQYADLLAAWRRLDRSLFLEGDVKSYARVDGPLPIGYGQTVSQPTLVLEMTRLLDPDAAGSVLEIGTGSGYQTALLSTFSGHVYTVERLRALADRARERLDSLGYANISYRTGDGGAGWPEHAPYNRILVTAGCSVLPPPLTEQLARGGRMVVPVGPRQVQDLMLVTRDMDGALHTESVMKVVFVELVGDYGWQNS
ncbi:MAG: protein-L-isoaspartate(D-aspartate) O-methyltransferase [Clostridia bacterium]|nr:protein-L-isoaspartate(D-aspartate) O-methyltransferase [Clostridia bacterium]